MIANIQVSKIKLNHESVSKDFYATEKFRICMIESGNGVWEIDAEAYSVSAGDAVLLNGRNRRYFRKVDKTQGLAMLIVEFDYPFMFNNGINQMFRFAEHVVHDAAIAKLLRDIGVEGELRLPDCGIVMAAKLTEIIVFLRRLGSLAVLGKKNAEALFDVLTYIDRDFSHSVSLSGAAKRMNLSAPAFSKYFSKMMGMGFAQYVSRKKISRAIYLLETTDKTVLDIMLACGFNNSASFYKAFKKATNLQPRDYRSAKKIHIYTV